MDLAVEIGSHRRLVVHKKVQEEEKLREGHKAVELHMALVPDTEVEQQAELDTKLFVGQDKQLYQICSSL